MPKSNSIQYPNTFQAQMLTPKMDPNRKSVEKDTKGNVIEKASKIIPTTKYYKCPSYEHISSQNCFRQWSTCSKVGIEFRRIHLPRKKSSNIDKENTGDDVGLNCIRPTPSTYLSV